jgi:hypothetical protein
MVLTSHHHERQASSNTIITKVLKHKRRYCRQSGCHRIVKSQGLCQKHGAIPKKCKMMDCEKQAQGSFNGMCSKSFIPIDFVPTHSQNYLGITFVSFTHSAFLHKINHRSKTESHFRSLGCVACTTSSISYPETERQGDHHRRHHTTSDSGMDLVMDNNLSFLSDLEHDLFLLSTESKIEYPLPHHPYSYTTEIEYGERNNGFSFQSGSNSTTGRDYWKLVRWNTTSSTYENLYSNPKLDTMISFPKSQQQQRPASITKRVFSTDTQFSVDVQSIDADLDLEHAFGR